MSNVDDFEQKFSDIVQPADLKAKADLHNAIAAVFWIAVLILVAIAPAIVWHVWTWAW